MHTNSTNIVIIVHTIFNLKLSDKKIEKKSIAVATVNMTTDPLRAPLNFIPKKDITMAFNHTTKAVVKIIKHIKVNCSLYAPAKHIGIERTVK